MDSQGLGRLSLVAPVFFQHLRNEFLFKLCNRFLEDKPTVYHLIHKLF